VLLGPEGELDEARYSTPELLATERQLLQVAVDRQGEGAGQVGRQVVEEVLAARPELSAEQEAMVAGLLGSGDGVQVVVGRADSGKTYALAPARAAWEAGAKLVLVGDHAQLAEIAAGGSFRVLAERLGALELSENRRQQLGWERRALVDVREGRAAEAVAAYAAHGRIHVAEYLPGAERALVADWLAAHRQGEQALMIAARLAEAERLSRLARAELVACGEVGGPERHLPCGPVSAGDRVMTLRNDAGLGVPNGMWATVLGPAPEGGLRVVAGAGAVLELPADYLEDGH